MNLRIDQSRLSSQERERKNKEKRTAPQRPVGNHEVYQNMQTGSHRRRVEKGKKRIFKEIMDENFPNSIIKNNNYLTAKKFNELQIIKLKQIHTKKHYSQTKKKKRQRILKATRNDSSYIRDPQ